MTTPQSESLASVSMMTVPAPPRHGRRLIQMLFRGNQDPATRDSSDSRWEDHPSSSAERPSQQQFHPRASVGAPVRQEHAANAPVGPLDGEAPRPPSGKFSALKRKLFPSAQRRAPVRVPALIPLSPIDTNNVGTRSAPDLAPQAEQADKERRDVRERNIAGNISNNSTGNNTWEDVAEREGNNDVRAYPQADCRPEDPVETLQRAVNTVKSARPGYDSDEDDLDLELAVETLDYESSNTEDTLAEITRVIEHVRAWKYQHDHKTLQRMRQMEQEAASLSPRRPLESSNTDESIETMVAAFQEERAKLGLGFGRDTFDPSAVKLCPPLCPTLGETEAARIADALHTDQTSSVEESYTLARLREELFQLEVRERHANMQTAMLQELEGAETALDLKIVDVEAYTSALDLVLAQFDAAATDS